MGIRSVRDLARQSLARLRDEFGAHGESLYRLARGQDDSPVVASHDTKSISQERTFDRDTTDAAQIRRCLLDCAQGVGSELRRQGLMARTITLKLRFDDFQTLTRGLTLALPSDLDDVIYDTANGLLDREWKGKRKVRLVGVRASNLMHDVGYQLQLFEQGQEKQAQLARAMDNIRARFGEDAIQRASLVRKAPPRRLHPPADS
jgi:DNA polymerase IV